MFICNLDITDVDIEAPNINAIQATFITTSNDEIVYLFTGVGIEDRMESRAYLGVNSVVQFREEALAVYQSDIMNWEVLDIDRPDEAWLDIRLGSCLPVSTCKTYP